jgi:hypothetical protein
MSYNEIVNKHNNSFNVYSKARINNFINNVYIIV